MRDTHTAATRIVDPNPYDTYRRTKGGAVHNPSTVFGCDDHGVDPAVPDLVRQVQKLEDENAALREQLQDAICELQAKDQKLRRLQNVALQSKRAVEKLYGFMDEHIR